MKTPFIFHTNKSLIQTTLLSPFRDLRVKCIPSTEKQTLKQFSSLHSYYLVEPIHREIGDLVMAFDNILKTHCSEIFCNELTAQGIPFEKWPDYEDYNIFKEFISVTLLSLTADLNKMPLKTSKVEYFPVVSE